MPGIPDGIAGPLKIVSTFRAAVPDIHLTNEYRYQLVRESDVDGYHTYEVRFEPPPNAPESLPLYRGTVWIDAHTWARVRLSMVQLNLTGNVLSNEERVDFQPFARASHALMTAADVAKTDPREIVWLPLVVGAQQVISAAGRASVVLRETTFSDFRVEPADYAERLAAASASDARMVRESAEADKRVREPMGLRELLGVGECAALEDQGFVLTELLDVSFGQEREASARKKRSKMCSWSWAAMPIPVSNTSRRT